MDVVIRDEDSGRALRITGATDDDVARLWRGLCESGASLTLSTPENKDQTGGVL